MSEVVIPNDLRHEAIHCSATIFVQRKFKENTIGLFAVPDLTTVSLNMSCLLSYKCFLIPFDSLFTPPEMRMITEKNVLNTASLLHASPCVLVAVPYASIHSRWTTYTAPSPNRPRHLYLSKKDEAKQFQFISSRDTRSSMIF